MRVLCPVLWLIIALLVLPTVSAAQESSMRGVVTDRQGGVVGGADVVLTSEAGAMRTAMTRTDGGFAFVSA